MSHAPKGGTYISDKVGGTEVFYKGGQFLPQDLPKSAKTFVKKVDTLVKARNGVIEKIEVLKENNGKSSVFVFIIEDEIMVSRTCVKTDWVDQVVPLGASLADFYGVPFSVED